MFVVLYRWRLKEGLEKQFEEGWLTITEEFLETSESFGSRLHRGDDDIWYAYAQWPSRERMERANWSERVSAASERMSEAVQERFPETVLEIVADRLKAES